MNLSQKRIRSQRVKEMNVILHSLFPESIIHLHHTNTWELLVAVILSAQCTDARVNEVTKALFKKYTTVHAYAKASQEEMERMVFQTGFFRAKARYIRTTALAVIDRHAGVVPSTMAELILLPGVGRKTANVILSNAFHTAEGIAVDTHVRRFAIRFDLTEYTDPKRIERDLMEIMPSAEWWGFNHRLVEYGRAYCKANKHDCREHPLTKLFPKAQEIWPRAH